MNPAQDDPNKTPAIEGIVDLTPEPAAVYTPLQSDEATLQAIEALEAEDSPLSTIPLKPDVPLETPIMQMPSQPDEASSSEQVIPDVEVQPEAPVEKIAVVAVPVPPTVSNAMANSLKDPTSTSAPVNPFINPKKSSKKIVIICSIIAFLIAGIAIGYYAWLSFQPAAVTETVENTVTADESNPTIQAEVLGNE